MHLQSARKLFAWKEMQIASKKKQKALAMEAQQRITIEEVQPFLLRALESSQGFRFDRHRPFEDYQGGSTVLEVIKNEINACVAGKYDKQSRSVVSVISGMGDGKSRLLDEMKSIMQGNASFKEQTCYTLYCNFENGASAERVTLGAGRRDEVEKEIMDRIMFVLMTAMTDGPCPAKGDFRTYQKDYHWSFHLQGLITATQDISPNAIVMVLVDGAHNMDPMQTEGVEEFYEKSCLRQVFRVLSDTICSSPRVFAACTSITSLLLKKTAGDSPNAKKLLVTPPSITKMPQEVQNSVVLEHSEELLQLFGEHPRTLEFLVDNTSTTLSGIFEAAAASLEEKYKLSDVGTDVIVPLLQRTLTGDGKFRLDEKIGNITCDYLTRIGLVKLRHADLKKIRSGHRYPLHISALLMLVLRSLGGTVLSTWRPYYEGANALEQFAASVRCIRSHVCEDLITLKDLHAGACWLKGGDTRVVKVPMQLAESSSRISTKGCDKAAFQEDLKAKGNWKVGLFTRPVEGDKKNLTTSSESIGDYTILNAAGAAGGDFFCRLKSDSGQHFNEVGKCKSKSPGASNKNVTLPDEIEKSVSSGDAFIMISQHPISCDIPSNNTDCAVVGPKNFHAYYGPLSGTVIVPSSSMLASRPVWPATLSLSPTRTRTTRWVPFLRRICKHI